MVAPAATLTVADVIADVKRAFGDEDGVQITDADIIRWINAGQREIVSNNPINKAKATISAPVGTNTFPMPADVYKIESVRWDGRLLVGMGFEEASAKFGPYPDSTGDPDTWYTWGNEFYLYPTPDTAKVLTLYYTEAPNNVSQSGEILSIPDQYFNALLEFVKGQAYELDEDWTAQQAKVQKFQFHMDRLKGDENNIQGRGHIITDPDMEWSYGY